MAINFYVKWVFGLSPVPNKLNSSLLVVGSANIEAKDLRARERCHSSGSSNIIAGVKKKLILTWKKAKWNLWSETSFLVHFAFWKNIDVKEKQCS